MSLGEGARRGSSRQPPPVDPRGAQDGLPLPSNSDHGRDRSHCQTDRTAADAGRSAMTTWPCQAGLLGRAQLPPYLVCSDKEQNLIERRREPQLAKPRDFPPCPTSTCGGSSPPSLLSGLSGRVTGLMRRAQLGGGRNGHPDRGHGEKRKPRLLGPCWNPRTPTETRQNTRLVSPVFRSQPEWKRSRANTTSKCDFS